VPLRIGNSDQLERSINLAGMIEEALKENPELDPASLLKMRNDMVPGGEKVSIGLSTKMTSTEVGLLPGLFRSTSLEYVLVN
jgi:hypothetical protein